MPAGIEKIVSIKPTTSLLSISSFQKDLVQIGCLLLEFSRFDTIDVCVCVSIIGIGDII